jgi:hypothetical protein
MRHPQVLVYESDGRLAELLRRQGSLRAWSLREPRAMDSCLRLLRGDGPSVLIIKLGKDLVRELTLLERVTWLFPDTATVVVPNTEDPLLAGLAWDLGASFVLFWPLAPQEFLNIVTGLMESAIGRLPAVAANKVKSTGPSSAGGSDA